MNGLIAVLMLVMTLDGCAQYAKRSDVVDSNMAAVQSYNDKAKKSGVTDSKAKSLREKAIESVKWCDPKDNKGASGYDYETGYWTGWSNGCGVGIPVDGKTVAVSCQDARRALGPGDIHKCVFDASVPAGKKGHWVEDKEAEARQIAKEKKQRELAEHQSELKKALTTRVLTEKELDEVLAIGPALNTSAQATYYPMDGGTYYFNPARTQGDDDNQWFADALKIQYEIRMLKRGQ